MYLRGWHCVYPGGCVQCVAGQVTQYAFGGRMLALGSITCVMDGLIWPQRDEIAAISTFL